MLITKQIDNLFLKSRNFLLFLFFVYSNLVFAQTTDTLENKLSQLPNDTNKINETYKQVFFLLSSGKKQNVLKHIYSSYKLSVKLNYTKGKWQFYNLMGILSRMEGNTELALTYFKNAINTAIQLKNKKITASSYHNIARIYDNQGNFNEALQHLFSSLKLKEQLKDERGIANTLGHIGHIYLAMGQSKKALLNHNKALQIEKKIKNTAGVIIALNDIGCVYEFEKNYEKSKLFFTEALKINTPIVFKPELPNTLRHLGIAYYATNQLELAKSYYEKSLKALDSITDYEQESLVLNELGKLNLKTGTKLNSLNYFLRAKEVAEKSGTLKAKNEANLGLSNVYAQLQKPELSLLYYKNYIHLRDCLINQSVTRTLLQKEFENKYEKKHITDSLTTESEKKMLTLKLKQERTNLYVLLLVLSLIIVICLFLFQLYKFKQKQKIIQLRNQMASDLHDDVGAALSSIKMLAGITKANPEKALNVGLIDKIEETSLETINSMNDIIWSLNSKNNSLNSLIEKMENHGASISKIKQVDFLFEKIVSNPNCQLSLIILKNTYLIFKEALNNTLKYAEATQIKVVLAEKNKIIHLSICDNGKGFNIIQNATRGNGLNNMRQRAKELNSEFELNSSNSGTNINVKIDTTLFGS